MRRARGARVSIHAEVKDIYIFGWINDARTKNKDYEEAEGREEGRAGVATDDEQHRVFMRIFMLEATDMYSRV
jgi:hypothetical protein